MIATAWPTFASEVFQTAVVVNCSTPLSYILAAYGIEVASVPVWVLQNQSQRREGSFALYTSVRIWVAYQEGSLSFMVARLKEVRPVSLISIAESALLSVAA